MDNKNQEKLTGIRKLLFPVYKSEFKKVIPMGMIYLGLIFVYTLTRLSKDMFMMSIGDAEVLSAAKVIVSFFAIAAAVLYGKISHRFSTNSAFIICLIPFLLFFTFFGIASNYTHIFHMSPSTSNYLISKFPYLKLLILSFGNWMYLFYYIFSELFASIIITASFWQFANSYTSFEEKKRFYPFYSGLCAQVSTYLAGEIFIYIGSLIKNTNNKFFCSLISSGSIFVGGVISLVSILYIGRSVSSINSSSNKSQKKNKSMGIKEIFHHLKEHPNVILASLLVVFYGICASSMELFWKKQVSKIYPVSTGEYAMFMGRYQKCIAGASILMGFLATHILKSFSWLFCAMVTPAIALISSFFLFGLVVLQKPIMLLGIFSGYNMIKISVIVGFIGLVFYKIVKYNFYDVTSEMYFGIQPQKEAQYAKVLQSIFSRPSKGIMNILFFILLSTPNVTVDSLSFFSWPICVIFCIIWIYVILRMNEEIILVEEQQKIKKENESNEDIKK
ncbi:hypothetical protein AB836_01010 [Rickettsiales bacterium (ex Bugula neritina AB1)]|nr:hypothetical protein AB836_01010 [Rickettsiales bacterium (ex Bugula neritina AB1)]